MFKNKSKERILDPDHIMERENWSSDLGNADVLLHLTNNGAIYCPPQKAWYLWDGSRWRLDNRNDINKAAARISEQYYAEAAALSTRGRIKSATDMAKAAMAVSKHRGYKDAIASAIDIAPILMPDDADADPLTLNVGNGLLNLMTGNLRPHDKEYRSTRICPVDYKPDALCPTWESFLDDIFPGEPEADDDGNITRPPDRELISYFQQALGYSLSGYTREQALFFLYGTGANGKSTAMNIASKILGDYQTKLNMTALQQTMTPLVPTEIANLPGSRMVITSEVPENKYLAENLVKDLTGGDTITARHLYGSWFSFTPQFKLWIYGNHKPRIQGTDLGIWRRIKLIPFTASFTGATRDQNMQEKLEQELPGILAWMVRGFQSWLTAGELIEPKVIADATNVYQSDSDIYGEFLDIAVKDDPWNLVLLNRDLFSAYKSWCDEATSVKTQSPRGLARAMDERGHTRRKGNPLGWRLLNLTSEGARLRDKK